MNGRVTIEDVASAAGVSRQTVSRVLNDKSDVSPETRQRILQIIAELGYRPSRIARGLATARMGTFGLVLPDVANPFFAEVARGAEDLARERDASLFLCNTDENPQRELAALQSLDVQHVDGIILCSPRLADEELHRQIPRLPPLVLVNHRLDAGRRPQAQDQTGLSGLSTEDRPQRRGLVGAVLIDDAAGAAAAVRHLWRQGHRTIGLLAGPAISHSARRRIQGYEAALAELGGTLNADWIRHCSASVKGGLETAKALLTQHANLTALLAYNDLVAAGALQACQALGLRVPEDVAVVGFDDIEMASFVTPPLTTLHVSARLLGQEAMGLLLRYLDAPANATEECSEIIVQPELIVRGSAPRA